MDFGVCCTDFGLIFSLISMVQKSWKIDRKDGPRQLGVRSMHVFLHAFEKCAFTASLQVRQEVSKDMIACEEIEARGRCLLYRKLMYRLEADVYNKGMSIFQKT